MISSILVVLSLSAALGLEPPEIISNFKSNESCLIEASKLNAQHSEALNKAKSVVVCLFIVAPTI